MYQRLADGSGDAERNRWDAAPDLEQFLASFYRYFEVKGLRGILAIHTSHLVALAFTIGFSFVLLFLVNWHALLSCDSEESCRAMPLYHPRPFQDMGLRRFSVLLCTILFLVYWIFNVVAVYHDVRDAADISNYYKERLGIVTDESLETMLWSEVVSRLIQQQKVSPFCIVQDELTALEIANIIMREDNFMIALTNHHAFTSRMPAWIPPRLAYTKAVLWNLRNAIFRSSGAFDHRSRIRREFLDQPEALAKRLRMLGLLNLVLVPPVLIFVGIYFFMRHAEEFRSQRSSPFRRQWTDYANWTFREFNELPHQFSARMCGAQTAAEAYLRSTRHSSPVLESLLRCVKFIAGSILAALLVVALWDDTPLLFVKIQDKNLLWYLAVFGFVFAVADSAGEENTGAGSGGGGTGSSGGGTARHAPSVPLRMYTALLRLVTCTHYLPSSWRSPASLPALAGACNGLRRSRLCQHFRNVRQELLRDFLVHRIQALAEELLGVVLCPLLLLVYLPKAAPDIVEIMRRSSHSSPCLGDWCSFGCLDPDLNGGEIETLGGGSSSAGEHHQAQYVIHRLREETLVTNGGKLEKSVLSFLLNHQLMWSQGTEDDNCRNEMLESQHRSRNQLGNVLSSMAGPAGDALGHFGESAASSVRELCQRAVAARAAENRSVREAAHARMGYVPPPITSILGGDARRAARIGGRSGDGVSIALKDMNASAIFDRADADEEIQEPGGEPLEWHAEGPPSAAPARGSAELVSDSASSGEAAIESPVEQLEVRSPMAAGSSWKAQVGSGSHYTPTGNDNEEARAAQVWGYPTAALRLLRDLEEFQHDLMASSSSTDYALLPSDLTRLHSTAAAVKASTPAALAAALAAQATAAADMENGKSQDSSDGFGAHFFWLEALHDFHSSQAQEKTSGVAQTGSESVRWSLFPQQPPLAQTEEP